MYFKRLFLICVIFFLISVITIHAEEETLTITTYYPSPYGSYNELRTNRMAVGYLERSDACWDPDLIEGCLGVGANITDIEGSRDIDLIVEGSVGIGTTNPQGALTVASGRIQVTSNTAPKGGAGLELSYNPNGYGDIIGYDRTNRTMKGLVLGDTLYIDAKEPFMTGNVGIGTTTPSARLEIHSSGTATDPFKVYHSDGSLAFYMDEDSNGETHVYVRDAAGNPKIGLRGNGDTYFNGGSVGIGDLSPDGKFEVNPDNTEDSGDEFVVKSNGRVGIGTTSPGAVLEVSGNIEATGGLDPNYDSGWLTVALNTNYTFTHNFGQRARDVKIWVAQNNDGSGWSFIANGLIYDYGGPYTVYGIGIAENGLNNIRVRVAEMLGFSYNATSSSHDWRSSGYAKVLAWK